MEINNLLNGEPDTLLVIRRGDLQEYSQELIKDLREELSKPVKEPFEKPLTQQEAIKFLGKSRQTFVNWRKKGIVSAYTFNGKLYYKPSELMAALKQVE